MLDGANLSILFGYFNCDFIFKDDRMTTYVYVKSSRSLEDMA